MRPNVIRARIVSTVALLVFLAAATTAAAQGQPSAAFEARLFALQQSDCRAVGEALMQVFEAYGIADAEARAARVVAYPESNTLIVCANRALLDRARAIIERLDAPEAPGALAATRIDASIFQVAMPAARAATLAAPDLEAVASQPRPFADHLATLGDVRVLGRIDQVINFREPAKLSIEASVPFVRSAAKVRDGSAVQNIDYQEVGCVIESHPCGAPGAAAVALTVHVTALSRSAVDAGQGIMAPNFHTYHQTYYGLFASARPIVLIAADPPGEKASDTTVCITRIVLTPIR